MTAISDTSSSPPRLPPLEDLASSFIPASSAAVPHAAPPRLHAPPSPPACAPARTTASWLLAWALTRSGFPAIVSIGVEDAATTAQTPRYAVHLARPLPIPQLLRILEKLRRSPRPIFITAEDHQAPPYREHLRLDSNQQVLSIRRNFRQRREVRSRAALVGVAWRCGDVAAPRQGAPWRTLRALLRQTDGGRKGEGRVQREHVELQPSPGEDLRSALVAQLTPRALRALADHLGCVAVGDFCFAHPSAAVDSRALLRGPLFIDAGATISADHIHLGPGWIDPLSPPVTLSPGEGGGAAETSGPFETPYFVGPGTRRRPFYDIAKRLFDILFSLAALLATLPICFVAAVLVKLYDRGPIFFAHRRESLHGRPFGCLKFRTMVRNAEALKKQLRRNNQVDGPQFKIAHDPRITPIGRFLRKTNIDELPQFLNVLLGHMSVVGPRPSPFEENQLCPAWREARLSVRPGITGLWQVSRSRERGDADFQEWIYFDTQYVERRSFWLDIRIILLTIKELFGQGQ